MELLCCGRTHSTTQTTVIQKCQRPENPQHNNLKLLCCGFSGRWHLWAAVRKLSECRMSVPGALRWKKRYGGVYSGACVYNECWLRPSRPAHISASYHAGQLSSLQFFRASPVLVVRRLSCGSCNVYVISISADDVTDLVVYIPRRYPWTWVSRYRLLAYSAWQSLKTCPEARTCLENENPCLEKSGSVLQFLQAYLCSFI